MQYTTANIYIASCAIGHVVAVKPIARDCY